MGPGWLLSRLNSEALEVAAIGQASAADALEFAGVAHETRWLQKAFTEICDAAMPRAGPRPQRRQVYWWNDEIAELRRLCVAARRQYTRCHRRIIRHLAAVDTGPDLTGAVRLSRWPFNDCRAPALYRRHRWRVAVLSWPSRWT